MSRDQTRTPSLSRRHFLGAAGLLGLAGMATTPAGSYRRLDTKENVMDSWPVLFVSHGAPLLAIDAGRGAPLRELGARLPTPRGIVVVSAHWEASPITVGGTKTLPLMYDFVGFPAALYEVRYPAPGAPALADRVVELLGAEHVRHKADRGWDHGTWTPLVNLYPAADVPVLQVSLPSALGAPAMFRFGKQLAPLRRQGVLLMGSGNMTHNLGALLPDGSRPAAAAAEFDDWARKTLTAGDFDALLAYRRTAPAFAENHPTEEHWLPLVFAAGAASVTGGEVTFPVTGFEFGNLSRRSVLFG